MISPIGEGRKPEYCASVVFHSKRIPCYLYGLFRVRFALNLKKCKTFKSQGRVFVTVHAAVFSCKRDAN